MTVEEHDGALVARARLDRTAFVALYTRYLDPVHRYCYRRLGSREAAEDATSQIFLQALAALPRYRDGSFRSWLFTIAHHVVIDLQRQRRPSTGLDAIDLPAAEPSPEEHAVLDDSAGTVQALLAELTPEQRQIVELRLAGLTGPEIARVLGKQLEAVKSLQFRAYARLRRLIESGAEREGGEG